EPAEGSDAAPIRVQGARAVEARHAKRAAEQSLEVTTKSGTHKEHKEHKEENGCDESSLCPSWPLWFIYDHRPPSDLSFIHYVRVRNRRRRIGDRCGAGCSPSHPGGQRHASGCSFSVREPDGQERHVWRMVEPEHVV